MPRDKVALLINSCAKKPKPRRVTPSAPRPAQRSEHIDDALMATKRRRVAFGDVSIHVFPMAIADNPAVRSGVALGLGREEVCCIVKSVDEHQPLRPRFYPRSNSTRRQRKSPRPRSRRWTGRSTRCRASRRRASTTWTARSTTSAPSGSDSYRKSIDKTSGRHAVAPQGAVCIYIHVWD